MNDKRFTLIDDPFEPIMRDNGRFISEKEAVALLNQLNDENEQLRQTKKILQQEINDTQQILEILSEKLKGW